MKSVVLFDVNGTLVPAIGVYAKAWQQTLAHFGIFVDYNTIHRQIGRQGEQLLSQLVPLEERQRSRESIEQKRQQILKREFFPYLKPAAGARLLLEALRGYGFRLALASSHREELEFYRSALQADEFLAPICRRIDIFHFKPTANIFAVALDDLGAPAHKAIAVVSTPFGAEAADDLGIKTIGLSCSGWDEMQLKEAGCSEVYPDLESLLAQLDQSLFRSSCAA